MSRSRARARRAAPPARRRRARDSQRSASATIGRGDRRGRALARWPRAGRRAGARCPSGSLTVNVVPAPELARDADRAAVELDEIAHQREPDPGALVRARRRPLDAMEALEHPRELVRRRCPVPVSATSSSTACVAIVQGDRGPSPSSVNFSALERRLRTIFSHMSRSTWTGLGERRAVDLVAQAAALHRRAKGAREIRGQRREIGGLVAGLDAARLDAREVEQRVDQLEQAQLVAVDDLERLARVARAPATRARPRSGRASRSAACGTRG